MPFYYYGGKSKIAGHYPAPKYGTIIEPFAGAAGYSLHYATPDHRVILIEKNPAIAALWRRLQKMTPDEVMAIECPPAGERTTEPLVIAGCAGQQFANGKWYQGISYQVTARMKRDFPKIQRRVAAAIPRIASWEILEGHCGLVAPDMEATWFIDPPYWVHPDRRGTNGDVYAEGSDAIDFDRLGEWCRTRRGQTIVCEQLGASWLPFRHLVEIQTTASGPSRRTEVIWTQESDSLASVAA